MSVIKDPEFGEIIVRPHHNATRISLNIAPDGRLRASTPKYTPLISVKTLIKLKRPEIRKLLSSHRNNRIYDKNQPIGKSHTLVIQQGPVTSIKTIKTKILVSLSSDDDIGNHSLQHSIRQAIVKALRKEAKSYLPRRTNFIAKNHGFSFDRVRLTHTSSRWGSCSSAGTISLNIALMQLPFELIDYVIAHELSHTRQMNHSQDFWQEVAQVDPQFKLHKQQIKKFTPNI